MRRGLTIAFGMLPLCGACAAAESAGVPEVGLPKVPAKGAGDLIAYTRNVNGSTDVWVTRSDGSRRRRVTFSPRQADGGGSITPAWSPDGRRLAYVATRDRPSRRAPWEHTVSALFTARADGSRPRRLTRWHRTPSFLARPEWSPDGRVIAFDRYVRGGVVIEWVPAAGGEPQRLGSGPKRDMGADWSPDGRSLLFTRVEGSGSPIGEVWVMDATGANARRLADGGGARWSPDGTRIAFASTRDRNGRTYYDDRIDPNTEVYVMRPDGSDQRRLTHSRANDGAPTWSPDGRWIVFDSGRPARINFNHHLWIMRADGRCQRRLVPGRHWSSEPSWQPGRPGAGFAVPGCG